MMSQIVVLDSVKQDLQGQSEERLREALMITNSFIRWIQRITKSAEYWIRLTKRTLNSTLSQTEKAAECLNILFEAPKHLSCRESQKFIESWVKITEMPGNCNKSGEEPKKDV